MSARVFVYGTLQIGGANEVVARRAGLVRAEPATLRGYRLFDLQPEGYPAVVPGPGVVHGEVLELAGPLDELDALEGVDECPPLYRRVRCTPEGAGDAWLYVYARPERLARPGATWLPSGRWPPQAHPFET